MISSLYTQKNNIYNVKVLSAKIFRCAQDDGGAIDAGIVYEQVNNLRTEYNESLELLYVEQ